MVNASRHGVRVRPTGQRVGVRAGLLVVCAAVLGAAQLGCEPERPLPPVLHAIPDFRAQDQAGQAFTLADISVMPSIVRMEDLGLYKQWRDLPRVSDWYRRLQARPTFAITYYPGTRDLGPAC